MDNSTNPAKGSFWKLLAILFVCIDLILVIYWTHEFSKSYKWASSIDGQLSSYSLPSFGQQFRDRLVDRFIIIISTSIVVTCISVFFFIRKDISWLPLLMVFHCFYLRAGLRSGLTLLVMDNEYPFEICFT